MSKELNKTTEEIMNKIHNRQIKMRPRLYFVLGYILTLGGLIFSLVSSVFFVGLIRFTLRSHGPMGQYRFEQLLSNFPWWALFLAIVGLVLGIWLLRRYDFSYKVNFKLLIISLIVSVLVTGFLVDMIGLNNFWAHRRQGREQRQSIRINNHFVPPNINRFK